MPNFIIEAQGEAREIYSVEAENEDEAREKFESGQIQRAYLTEVSSSELVSIEEDDS